MKRLYRLRQPGQFQKVRRTGRTYDGTLVALNAAYSRRRASRCGFVVSKKLGGAVVRNRCKRRTREAVRLAFAQIAPGWDLVFVIRSPAVATVVFADLQSIIHELIGRAGAWRTPSAEA